MPTRHNRSTRLGYAFALLLFLLTHPVFAAIEGYHFVGAINGTLAIQMNSHVTGKQIAGDYLYSSQGRSIALDGTVDKKGNVSIREYSGKDETAPTDETGKFIGLFTNNRHVLTGAWSSPGNKRKLPFVLHAVAEYHSIEKQVKRSAEDTYTYSQSYPVILNPSPARKALNQRLSLAAKRDMTTNLQATKKEGDPVSDRHMVDIAYIDSQLCSIMTLDSLDLGGVHPFASYDVDNYQFTKQGVQLLTLDQLFDPKSDYRKDIFLRVQSAARRQAKAELDHFFEEKATLEKLPFRLTPGSITFIYPQEIGEMAGYFVTIPATELRAYLNPTGLWQRFIQSPVTYKQYINPRYGFSINYPSSLKLDDPPENGDGQRFFTADGFVMTASGINCDGGETLASELARQEKDFSRITYQTKDKDWFVLSGTKGSTILYRKTYIGKGSMNHLYIAYPAALIANYNDIVTNVVHSFKPGEIGKSHYWDE